MKYRNKLTQVTAIQFVDGKYGNAIDFCPSLNVTFAFVVVPNLPPARSLQKATLGDKPVSEGDWLVKASDNTFSVVKHADFITQYEAA